MHIQKWIKTAAVFVLAAGMTVSVFVMIHAAGQDPAVEPADKKIQTPAYADGTSALVQSGEQSPQEGVIPTPVCTDEESASAQEQFSQGQKTPPPCGVSDDADKLSLFVSFQVLESSAEGCRLQIKNYSAKHLLTTGYAFSLEVKKDGEYVPAVYHTAPCWPEIAWIAEPGGTVELWFDWRASYGSLAPGEYRIATEYFSETSAFTQKTPFTVI